MSLNKLSDAEKSKILTALEAGNSITAASIATGHSKSTVSRIAERNNLSVERERKADKSFPIEWTLGEEMRFLDRLAAGCPKGRYAPGRKQSPCDAIRNYRAALKSRVYGFDGGPMTPEVREALIKHCDELLSSK